MTVLNGSPLLLREVAAASDDDYQIERSLRFQGTDDAHLTTVNLSHSGNTNQWTWSAWIKRTELTKGVIWGGGEGSDGHDRDGIFFQDDDTIIVYWRQGGTTQELLQTNRVFRDTSAWFHLVWSFDYTNTIQGDTKSKLWINGEQVTDWQHTFDNDVAKRINTVGNAFWLGKTPAGDAVDMLISDAYFVDGLVLNPAAFGKFNDQGAWVAKSFAIPAPNDGTTRSNTVTTGGASLKSATFAPSSGKATNLFNSDGIEYGAWTDGPDNSTAIVTWKPPSDITADCSIRIGLMKLEYVAGATFTINGVDLVDDLFTQTGVAMDGTSATSKWYTAPTRTITAADGITWAKYSSDKEIIVSAIEVDGVLLRDGITDVSTRNNLNDGRVWSDYWTATQGSTAFGYGFEESFDGSISSRTSGNNDSILKWVPPTTITAEKSIELYMYLKGALQGENDFKVNNVSKWTDAHNELGDYQVGWYDIGKTIDATNGIQIGQDSSNDNTCFFYAMRVDGHILIDSTLDNTHNLKFGNTTKRYLGYSEVLNTCTGAQPMYGPGAEDEAKANLVFAMPGYDLNDHSATIKGSGTNKTVTASGNAQVSTDKAKFYGSSIKLDGTGDYLEVADHADFALGSGDFCMECWANWVDASLSGSAQWLFGVFKTSSGQNAWGLRTEADGTLNLYLSNDGGESVTVVGAGLSTTGVIDTVWHHIAAVRNSNTITIYVDGKSVASSSYSAALHDSDQPLLIGRQGHTSTYTQYMNGFIQDIRIYKGAAKYTAAFTPPARTMDHAVHSLVEAGGTEFEFTNLDSNTYKTNIQNASKSGLVVKDKLSSTGAPPSSGDRGQWLVYQNSGTASPITVTYNPPIPTTSEFSIYGGSYNDSSTAWTATVTYTDGTTASNSGSSGSGNWWDRSSFSTSGKSVKSAAVGAVSYANFMGVSADNSNNVVTHVGGQHIDSLVDSPTPYGTESNPTLGGELRGNYPTLNPLAGSLSDILNQGNLGFTNPNSNHKCANATFAFPKTGKYYLEFRAPNSNPTNGSSGVGITNRARGWSGYPGTTAETYWIYSQSDAWYHYPGQDDGNIPGVGDFGDPGKTWQFAIDMDNQKIFIGDGSKWYRKGSGGNTKEDDGNPVTGANPTLSGFSSADEWFFFVEAYDVVLQFNFGQRAFTYTAPTGYKCLCSNNLPDTFSGEAAATVNNPSKFFDVKTYTGTGVDDTDVKGLSFQPDMVWLKRRNAVGVHGLWDVIRGTNILDPSTDSADTAYGTPPAGGYISQFNSDGWRFKNGSTNNTYTHVDGGTYVSMAWDAGTAASGANEAGSLNISSGNQWVNQTAGFSITKYTGPGSGDFTFGHGLNAVPQFLMVKQLDSAGGWICQHKSITLGTGRIVLNTTQTSASNHADIYWNSTAPTNSLITIGDNSNVYDDGGTFICYAWAEIPGYSSFGTYEGNASTDGPFVYTGFLPRFIMMKGIDNERDWVMMDTERDADNVNNFKLYPNGSYIESDSTAGQIDVLSNGFKLRGTHVMNNGSETYIYCAWADQPFKISRAQ